MHVCKECHWPMTFAQQKVQNKRLKELGYNDVAIKEALPRCQKCMTRWIDVNVPGSDRFHR
jgi:hypothetical protein